MKKPDGGEEKKEKKAKVPLRGKSFPAAVMSPTRRLVGVPKGVGGEGGGAR